MGHKQWVEFVTTDLDPLMLEPPSCKVPSYIGATTVCSIAHLFRSPLGGTVAFVGLLEALCGATRYYLQTGQPGVYYC